MIEFSSEMGTEELRARAEDARAQGADVRLEEVASPFPPLPRGLEYVRLDQVQHAPRNPKGHDPVIGRMIAHHGLGEVPLRDDRTGRLVAGHGRHEQLVAMHASGASAPDGITVDPDGMWRMPVITGWSSRSDPDAEAYLVGSNESAAAGGWEPTGLAAIIKDLQEADLGDLTGFDEEALTAILEAEARRTAAQEPAQPPGEFPAYDENIPIQHKCPACGYEWSGNSRPGASDE